MAEKHRYQPVPCRHCFEPIVWAKNHRDSIYTRGVLCGSYDTYEVVRLGWRKHKLCRVIFGVPHNNRVLLGTYDSFKHACIAAELHRHMTSNCGYCKQPY